MAVSSIEIEIQDNPGYVDQENGINLRENDAYFNPGQTESTYDVEYDRSNTQEVKDRVKPKITKEKWDERVEYTFNTIGYVVGLGNIWRFSSFCYKYGGGVFILVYTLFYLSIGLPLFVLEIYLGQFTSRGCIECWGNCRILKAVGVGSVALTTAIIFTYAIFVVWSLKYLVLSFFDPLPWSNVSMKIQCNPNCSMSAYDYFRGEGFHIGESTGIGDLGSPKWELVLAGFFLWLLLFLCLFKGLKFSGKVVYFTVLFPYLSGLVLLFHGLTLNGSSKGLADYMSIKDFYVNIGNNDLWTDAATQILFSLSLAQGGLTCLSSFNDLRSNLVKDAIIVTLTDYFTSLLLGVVVFSYVGYVKYELKLQIGDNWDGLQLLFVIVPQAISETNLSRLWSIIFFLHLISLAFDVLLTFIRTIGLAIYEGFPNLPYSNDIYINLVICTIGFITTIALSTSGGIYLFQLIKHYGDSWTMYISALLECVLTMLFYGGVPITVDIEYMLRDHPITVKAWKYVKYYFLACWFCVTPIFLVYLILSKWITLGLPFTVYRRDYPPWSAFFGWVIALCIPMSVIIPLCVYFAKATGSINKRFKYIKNSNPGEPLWSIASEVEMAELIEIKRLLNKADDP